MSNETKKSRLSTTLNTDILKRVKMYAIENDMQINEVIEEAILLLLETNNKVSKKKFPFQK